LEKHWVEQAFERSGAILKGHFCLASNLHSDWYLDKFLVYTDPTGTEKICVAIAYIAFYDQDTELPIQIVVGPEKGGIVLAHTVARLLREHTPNKEVISVFTEKGPQNRQTLRESFRKLVAGKRVLIVDDILLTGGSVRQVIEAIENCYGQIVRIGVICNRGKVTSQDIGGFPLFALWETEIESWEPGPEKCPLCKAGVPITELK